MIGNDWPQKAAAIRRRAGWRRKREARCAASRPGRLWGGDCLRRRVRDAEGLPAKKGRGRVYVGGGWGADESEGKAWLKIKSLKVERK